MKYTVLNKKAGGWNHQFDYLAQLGALATHPNHPTTVVISGIHSEEKVSEVLGLAAARFNITHTTKSELPFPPRF